MIERDVERDFGITARWDAEFRRVHREPGLHPRSISIVIPVRNGKNHVGVAIESAVASARAARSLDEELDVELVVVDDASGDATPRVLAELAEASPSIEFQVLRNPTRAGAAISRNVGAFHARGEVLCFLDADDYWLLEHIPAAWDTMYAGDAEYIASFRSGIVVEEDSVLPEWRRAIENAAPINLCIRADVFRFIEGYPVHVRTPHPQPHPASARV